MLPRQRIHWPTVFQLLLSGLGLMLFLASTFGLLVAGILAKFGGGLGRIDPLPLFTYAWMSLVVSLLLLPSLVYALLRLFGREGRSWKLPHHFLIAAIALIAWPALILAGQAVSVRPTISWLVLPPIQALAVVIPLWFLIELGRRGLRAGSPQRQWGVLSVGLLITPTLTLIVESVLLLVLAVGAGLWLSQNPDALTGIQRLLERLANPNLNNESLLRILRPYLQQPVVIYAILALVAGVLPVIEELLKPLGVWGIASLRITPAEGFVAGLISGAAFALLETSGALRGMSSATWAATVIGRTGTGLLHTITAGLTGWGLALAWSKAAYLRLAGIFLLSFALHAAWNTLAIFMGAYATFNAPAVQANSILGWISSASPYALGVLAVTMLLILIGVNSKLRREGRVASREQAFE